MYLSSKFICANICIGFMLMSVVGYSAQGFRVESPESQGLDSKAVQSAVDEISIETGSRFCTAIVKNGVIINETYYKGDANTDHNIQSLSKNLAATVVGVAITQGYFDLDDLMTDYMELPKGMTPGSTVRHVLSQVSESPDLDFPDFSYDTYGVIGSLNDLLAATTGMSPRKFAKTQLLDKLGMNNTKWGWPLSGRIQMGAGARSTCRDVAKVGQLYLNSGVWHGERILSQSFIAEATRSNFPKANYIYGLTWWLNSAAKDEPWSSAMGKRHYGKVIKTAGSSLVVGFGFLSQIHLISRDHNAVVVTLGRTLTLDVDHPTKAADAFWPVVGKAIKSE